MRTYQSIPARGYPQKPPPGARLVEGHPLIRNMVLGALFAEGFGAQTFDYSPANCKTYLGPLVLASSMGLSTTGNSYFSGWGCGETGPALLIVSTDTVAPGGPTTQASSVDFKGNNLYWPNCGSSLTVLCKWFNFNANNPPMLWGTSSRDSSAGAFALYTSLSTNNLTFGDGITEWNSGFAGNGQGQWITAGCAHELGSRDFIFNKKINTVSGASTGATTLIPADPWQYVGVGWLNAGSAGVETGSGWDGLVEWCYVWNRKLLQSEMLSICNDPYQIFETSLIKRFFFSPSFSETAPGIILTTEDSLTNDIMTEGVFGGALELENAP